MSQPCRLSIVVVTWNNENHIEKALDSCVFPGLGSYEVVVVHNNSDDRTREVMYRAINRHPDLFRVVENDENEGLGEARNIGVQNARGDYVMFLDGDDWYAPEAGQRIMQIIEGEAPDVLVFNHARAWDTGGIHKNAHSEMLATFDCSALPQRLKILENFNVAWNKVYRRQFILDNDLAFSRRLYEDIDWHFKVLVRAKKYLAIQDVLIHYRQRYGSILRSENDKHFDVIDQYEEVLRFLKDNPDDLKRYGRAAYHHARKLMMNVFLANNRIPKSSEGRFLRQMSALLKDWRQAIGLKKTGIMVKAARFGSPMIFRAAERVRLFRNESRGTFKKYLRDSVKKSQFVKDNMPRFRRWLYAWESRKPIVDNLVLMESYWGQKVDCNPLAIAEELRSRGGYDVVWSVKPGAKIPPEALRGFRTVPKGSEAFIKTLARAKYLINNANYPTEYEKRDGQVYVQTKHGTPLKFMGTDIRKKRPGEMNWLYFAMRCRRWDYVISSNPYSSRVWRQGFPYNYEVLEAGYPRNDRLFNASPAEISTLRSVLGVPHGKKVALYAPTFRHSAPQNDGAPSDQSEVFDFDRVAEALGEDYVLLVRSHYFEKPKKNPDSVIDVSSHPSTADVMLATDLLITDYSSIMFDFACLKRPIVLYQYDLEQYERDRGTYMDLENLPPGPIVYDQNALLDVLENRDFESRQAQAARAAFSAEFCPWDDGHAAARVVDQVFGAKGE